MGNGPLGTLALFLASLATAEPYFTEEQIRSGEGFDLVDQQRRLDRYYKNRDNTYKLESAKPPALRGFDKLIVAPTVNPSCSNGIQEWKKRGAKVPVIELKGENHKYPYNQIERLADSKDANDGKIFYVAEGIARGRALASEARAFGLNAKANHFGLEDPILYFGSSFIGRLMDFLEYKKDKAHEIPYEEFKYTLYNFDEFMLALIRDFPAQGAGKFPENEFGFLEVAHRAKKAPTVDGGIELIKNFFAGLDALIRVTPAYERRLNLYRPLFKLLRSGELRGAGEYRAYFEAITVKARDMAFAENISDVYCNNALAGGLDVRVNLGAAHLPGVKSLLDKTFAGLVEVREIDVYKRSLATSELDNVVRAKNIIRSLSK